MEDSLFHRDGAGFVIANSHLVRSEITAHYLTYPPERIAVVYNGLPAGHFKPTDADGRARARRALGLESDDLALLFAGTGWERKGLACALEAVARLPVAVRARLLVAGKGNPRPYLRRLKPRAAERVRFLGPIRNMAAVYAAADVFVLPHDLRSVLQRLPRSARRRVTGTDHPRQWFRGNPDRRGGRGGVRGRRRRDAGESRPRMVRPGATTRRPAA